MLIAPLTHPRVQTVPHEGAVPINTLYIQAARGRFLLFRRTDWHSILVGSAMTLEDAVFRLHAWR